MLDLLGESSIGYYFEYIISYFTDQGISRGLAIVYLAVSALLVVMAIAALVMWIRVMITYYSTNRVRTSSGKTSFQIAREMLDKEGLRHVKVKRASFLRAWIFGNSYSLSKKTIFLRGSIADKDSITAVGVALEKVGIAKLCESGDTKARTRNMMQVVGLFGPMLFIPCILIGMLIDFLVFSSFGMFSIIGIALGLVFVGSGFIVTLLNLPVEKKATKMALEMVENSHLFTDGEVYSIKKVLDTYITAYICDFIVAVLRLVQLVLEIVMNFQIASKNQ